MILEQNVPAPIRTWAACQVKIRRCECAIRHLEAGEPVDFRSFAAMKALGRTRYRADYCRPEIARLKRRCARYRVLADRIRRNSATPPERYLFSKDEALNRIGSTLHYRIRGREVYDTLLRCSEDGARIYSTRFNGAEGKFLAAEAQWLDPLSLLSLGFGKPA